jgi:hypothetical protein
MRATVLALVAIGWVGCTSGDSAPNVTDAGSAADQYATVDGATDTSAPDATVADTTVADANVVDTSVADTSVADVNLPDATLDAGDAVVADSGPAGEFELMYEREALAA